MWAEIIISVLLTIVTVLQAYMSRTISRVEHNTNSLTEQLMAFSKKEGHREGREEKRIIDSGSEEKP